MSRFSDQIARGLGRLRETAGGTVMYSRGAYSVTLTAVPGQSEYTTTDDVGMPVTNRTRDFIFKATDLVLNGSVVEPQQGDRIAEDGRVYTLLQAGDLQPWQYSDWGRSTIRVRTKQTA